MKARLAAFLAVLSMMGATREASAITGNTPPGEALTISNTGSPNFTQGATGCTSTSVSFNSNSLVTCNSGAWAVQPVQIGTSASPPQTCSSTYAGMMYENSGTNTIQYCNGSIWTNVGAGSLSGSTGYDAIWTSPTAIGTGLLFESGSNVGIGTASPQNLLDVNGAASIGYNVAAPSNGLIVSGNVGIGTSSANTQLYLASNANDFFTVNTAVNSAGMNLNTSDGNGSAFLNMTKGSGGGSSLIKFFEGATQLLTIGINGSNLPIIQGSGFLLTISNNAGLQLNGGASQSMTFFNGNSELMRLTSAGNLGIGTTSPLSSLSVNGGAAIGSYAGTNAAGSGNLIVSGNVGIGTTSPQSKLQISGGEVQVGSSGSSCTGSNAGAISYSSNTLNYCNGSSWTSTGSGGGLPSGATQYQMIREGTSTPQWENAPYDVASFMPSTPQASSFINIVLPRNIQLPSGLPSSQCVAITAATASTTVTINKISGGTTTAEGAAVWAAAAKTCTFTFSSPISFAAGDMVQFAFPSTADATLANVSITLAGIRQ